MLLKERFIRKWYHDVYEFGSDFILILLGIIINLLFLLVYGVLVFIFVAISIRYCKPLLLIPFIIYYLVLPWIIYQRSYVDGTIATMDRKTFKTLSKIFDQNFVLEREVTINDLTNKNHLYTLIIKYKKIPVKIPFIAYLKCVKEAKRETFKQEIQYYKDKLGIISEKTKQGNKKQRDNTKKLIEEITKDIDELKESWNNGN